MPEHEASEKLFSYGTLQQENVQIATFGRKLEGRPDRLIGYRIDQIESGAGAAVQDLSKKCL